MSIEELIRKTYEKRVAAGMLASDGVACANTAEKAWRDFRFEMKQRDDWGNLPPDLEVKLQNLADAYRAASRT